MDRLKEKKGIARKAARGFTLLESVIAIVMFSFFALSILTFTKPLISLWNLQTFQQGPAAEGRLALLRMVREASQVKNRSSITTAGATTLVFTDTGNQQITYTLSSGSLTRNSVTLAKGVSALSFAYYDVNNNTTATLANIRRVSMQLTVTAGGRTTTLKSQAHPENLY